MVLNTKKSLTPIKNRSFLNKDFDQFRRQLLDYARTYFPDRIQDFSEASLGGLLLELVAYVGDTTAFYLDHQFRELDPETAVERLNIERLARQAGVEIQGAAPAVADVSFTVKVPAELAGTIYQPQNASLPIIKANTSLLAEGDIIFSLTEDIDFSEKDSAGDLFADKEVFDFNEDGTPASYLLTRVGSCVSGERVTETFVIPDSDVPFRTVTLSNSDVSEVIDVRDIEGNVYYEVDFLTQDTVFSAIENIDDDNRLVKNNIQVIPAPYRFVKETTTLTGLTTLRFGNGDAGTLDGDIVPDPSELALPLYGKKNFSRFTVDPTRLLNTRTLGISPRNTTLTIQYRSGGGLDHNVSSRAINTTDSLIIEFPNGPTAQNQVTVSASTSVSNDKPAAGGDDALSIEEIRGLIGSSRNVQSRIVTKQDLFSRIYTMPSNFGRVFRAGVSSNSRNPLATNLYIVSRNGDGNLSLSPDTLKKNLSTYLNEFRIVSDALDILDARIINVQISFEISVDPSFNSDGVLSRAIDKLVDYTAVENFQIGQPIRLSDLTNLIYNTPGVVSVVDVSVGNLVDAVGSREYSKISYDIAANTRKGLILPPEGGIFEIKFPTFDIRGRAV